MRDQFILNTSSLVGGHVEGGHLLVGVPNDGLATFNRAIIIGFSLGLLFFVSAGVGSGVIIGRQTNSCLNDILDVLRAASGGDLESRIETRNLADEIFDISEGINNTMDNLQQKTLRLQRLSANIAHDLRTPIVRANIILNRLVENESTGEDSGRLICRAIGELSELNHLFECILRLADISDESRTSLFCGVDLLGLVYDVSSYQGIVAKEDNISLRIPSDQENKAMVFGDYYLLRQLLVNVVENAIKYSGEHGNISISLIHKRNNIVLRVDDNGVGISPQ